MRPYKVVPFSVVLLVLASLHHVSAQWNTNCADGRQAIVHLFEWRWDDIAAECERFLKPKGYCGVQVSPPSENVIVHNNNEQRPWWERYQPISYKIYSRSGSEDQFRNMVQTCNNHGIRVYVDIVFNHMCGEGMGSGTGVGGTWFDASTLSFPGVPYSSLDFNSDCDIWSYQDANQVRNCRLVGLVDLNQGKSYVQNRIRDFMNVLIDIGVAGFRVDAGKHMWPGDLKNVYSNLNDLSSEYFTPGSRALIFHEIIDHGGTEAVKASEYYFLGRVTEFNFGQYVTEAFRGENGKKLAHLSNFGEGWGYLMPEGNAVVFIDNHDNQRGHGGAGSVATFREPRLYKQTVTYMLAWNYGVPRVMSSYYWEQNWVNGNDANNWMGPPHDSNYNILGVPINDDDTCGNGWMCEHRWRQIYNMATFRYVVGWEPVYNWYDDGDMHIAFSRGSKGFYVANGSSWKALDLTLQTGLPAGDYCDVISGNISEDKRSCTGSVVTVDSDGRAYFRISNTAEDPMIAIHIGAKLSY